jgi:hypothetical protein
MDIDRENAAKTMIPNRNDCKIRSRMTARLPCAEERGGVYEGETRLKMLIL